MNKLHAAAALMCACVVLGYGQTKSVDLIDSTFAASNGISTLQGVVKHIYSGGRNTLDSQFNASGAMTFIIEKFYNAAGNDTLHKIGKPIGANINYNSAQDIYTYDSQNRKISDSYYTQNGASEKLLSVDVFYYGTNGKISTDSVFDSLGGRMLNYSVYSYTDAGDSILNYDSLSVPVQGYVDEITGGVIVDRLLLDNNNNETGYIDYTYGDVNIPVRYFPSNQIHQSVESSIRISGSGHCATIAFAMPSSSNVKVSLFDISGRLVKTLANGMLSEGTYSFGLTSLVPGNGYVLRIYGDKLSVSRQFSIQ